jgi:hypothetical protein
VSSRQALRSGCCGTWSCGSCRAREVVCVVLVEGLWKGSPEWVRAPYAKAPHAAWIVFPSSSELVEFAVNLPGPPGKPKYSLVTDSGLVP